MGKMNFSRLEHPNFEDSGQTRQVGFELEFTGLEMTAVADILAKTLLGKVVPMTQAECKVETSDLGTFKVELDWQLGKVIARQRQEEREPDEEDPLMTWLTTAAAEIVPVEVVCPPIAADKLQVLHPVVDALREAGAVGTSASPIYAFGVHINPELPDTKPVTIAKYLKAFCLSQEWLVDQHSVDLSRRITPYIDLFPTTYVRQVLSYDGRVTLNELIDDYIEHNPTRNRALDMTPLFRYLDEARLIRGIEDERINARPTFHYRLPNCHIGQAGWHLNRPWNLWCVVERLAFDSRLLAEMSAAWKSRDDQLIPLDGYTWHSKLDSLQDDQSSA